MKSNREEQLEKRISELEKLANYDLLTDLPNKRLFKNLLKKAIANASRNDYVVSVVLLDLDKFKDINDSYGHFIGDELIKNLSERLQKRVREGDIVARIDNDEFAIILEHINDENAIAQVVNNILKIIAQPSNLSNGSKVSIEASAGIVIAPKDSKRIEKLFEFAESSLFHAKQDGHGLYRFYTDDMTQKSMQKIAYRDAITEALNEKRLELHYQPKIDLKSAKVIGAEALVRWVCTKYGNVPPSIFIPIANETGLINAVGDWVINEACRQGKIWQDSNFNLPISINISTNQVKHHNIVESLSNALDSSGFKAENLELEMTEDALMEDKESIKFLEQVRATGVRIAIDKFGTGYSSLAYLRRLPIDDLKIDQLFIKNILQKKEDEALVLAIIGFAKAFGFRVSAMGVESKDQLEFLKDNGCDFYQGFIYSKALSAKQFEKLLKE